MKIKSSREKATNVHNSVFNSDTYYQVYLTAKASLW